MRGHVTRLRESMGEKGRMRERECVYNGVRVRRLSNELSLRKKLGIKLIWNVLKGD